MFWIGNYIAVRELNSLLKEENVSLTQVLEADDILQECKADNKALIQFLTKPEVLAELITLITEEPSKNVELTSQYRQASIACEVLTSQLSTLSDRLSMDTVQMHRLCDFINKEPPLNPLLASYFSKTVEMLLERSPKQDWYLYHIVCLRVLDFFKSRRDFLPNLLRHLATSAVADTFKYFLRLDDLFNKTVMEWLDEHQFLECLIQIICGTYTPEPLRPPAAAPAPAPEPAPAPAPAPAAACEEPALEKADNESTEKPVTNHKQVTENNNEPKPECPTMESNGERGAGSESQPQEGAAPSEPALDGEGGGGAASDRVSRMREVAAANAASLLCDLILNGCAPDGCTTRARTVWGVVRRLQSERWVRALLAAAFTSPPAARRPALAHAATILLALLSADPILAGQCASERTCVELAVAPHLPLLHQALLHDPDHRLDSHNHTTHQCADGERGAKRKKRVGAARVQVAALLAHLALSEVPDVPTTILTLGTPGVLLELFFEYPDNNFLHAQVYTLVKHALSNQAYRTQYATHLIIECDLLTRLMDVFEENENRRCGVRAGYMGHVVQMLRRVWRALDEQDAELRHALALPAPLARRWDAFLDDRLKPLLQQHDTPLGGYYPSDNIYEVDHMVELADGLEATYEIGSEPAEGGDGGEGGEDKVSMLGAKNAFLELAAQKFHDDMWDDAPEAEDEMGGRAPSAHDVHDVLDAVSPWESGGSEADSSGGGEQWAQFGAVAAPPPVDPYAPLLCAAQRGSRPRSAPTAFWPDSPHTATESSSQKLDVEESMQNLRLFSNAFDSMRAQAAEDTKLANNLLSAMSAMTPDLIANIVNANMPPAPPPPEHAAAATAPPAPAPDTSTADMSSNTSPNDNAKSSGVNTHAHTAAGDDTPHTVAVATNTHNIAVSTVDGSTSPADDVENVTVSSGREVTSTGTEPAPAPAPAPAAGAPHCEPPGAGYEPPGDTSDS